MPAITEPAPAKINLALHVRRRRPDGYHDLETLFAFATDGDIITVESAQTNSFTISGPFAAALLPAQSTTPTPGNTPAKAGAQLGVDNEDADGSPSAAPGAAPWHGNLVTAAADAFTTAFAPNTHHAITLEKHLPIASGIGGGSADAAATLRALARLHGIAATDPRLHEIAAKLGADVPACLANRTTLGTGKGDTLTNLESLSGTPLLLVNPGVAVSTAAVFKTWDGHDRGPIPEGDLLERAKAGRNDLEPPALALAPEIAQVRALLDAADDVLLSRMSGSGATCFALFETLEARDTAATAAQAKGWWTLATSLA
ncbi:4-(cytidine 5'-diphospho)-2-C-methyl-D-erythritol kinase [Sphingomonas sp. PB2P12]|uniref:4-(cytidine 5'-diphospho)-2-C-methyl-D-erythritol kinase n=1 Tax=Sphingomonas sandaracina TaxID=3096157 RepID=UPI002FCB2671